MGLERGVVVKAPFNGTVASLPVKIRENIFPQTAVDLNCQALKLIPAAEKRLVVVPGALEAVTADAAGWFDRYLR